MDQVIDSHCHIFPKSFSQNRAELSSRDATFAELFSPTPTGATAGREAQMATSETLIEAMDADGVAQAVVMGLGWTDMDLAREANDYLIRAVEFNRGRLTGLCSVDPSWGHAALAEIERCSKAGLKGIGELHPDTQGFDLDDKAVMTPVMGLAARLDIPVLIHTSEPVGHQYPGKGRTTPHKVYRFIENFPDNVIICAHWGGGLPFYALMPEVPAVLKNVYFDTAASPFLYRPQVFSTVAGLAGAEKILFATDFPLIKHGRAIGQVKEVIPAGKERDAILGGNAARLFGL
ncbi:MAG: hypothetical protein BZY80_06465 [SAR202 cluster bacterium Io17-Chloro-G2]|nr:MAG: hypothetical protein BZY80_06465 [SAR202 cluster bacterium Io17-Chloro-G2]